MRPSASREVWNSGFQVFEDFGYSLILKDGFLYCRFDPDPA